MAWGFHSKTLAEWGKMSQALRDESVCSVEPARTLAAEPLKLERTLSDLANRAYALTPAEIALMWQTAPPCMPIPADP